jgi:hypothetical protein
LARRRSSAFVNVHRVRVAAVPESDSASWAIDSQTDDLDPDRSGDVISLVPVVFHTPGTTALFFHSSQKTDRGNMVPQFAIVSR